MVFRKQAAMAEANNSAYDLPCPINIRYAWRFGRILGIFYVHQVVRGLLLACHYSPFTGTAFESLFYIQRDVAAGWAIRMVHANGARMLMLFCYLHIARGLYFNSPIRVPHVWLSGVVLLFLIIAAAFLGYVLPWGQIRFWGATVITNLFRVIPWVGPKLVETLWGGYTVGGPTLNRFFVFHFVVPLLIAPLILGHILLLHNRGSSNPLGAPVGGSAVPFHPYISSIDLIGAVFWLGVLGIVVLAAPHVMGCPDNFEKANPIKTPIHIQPEWYFLPFYAILRRVPHKTGGVIIMALSLVVLFLLPGSTSSVNIGNSVIKEVMFIIFVFNAIALGWIGACPLEVPFLILGAIHTVIYFLYFGLTGWVD